MKILIVFIVVVVCVLSSACINDGSPVYEKQLNGPYYLDAVDGYEDMAISIQDGENGVGVIKATIFAVGQNDDFIIAKQHPLAGVGNIDKTKINYFIIPLKFKVSRQIDRNYIGPLSLKEFDAKSSGLGIKNIEFTIIFEDIE